MNDTPIQLLKELCSQTIIHLDSSLIPQDRKAGVKDTLVAFLKKVEGLRNFEKKALEEPYCLSLVGLTNVGKSTLTQAILGYPIAPKSSGPTTAVPVEFHYSSDGWEIETEYRDVRRKVLKYKDAESLTESLKPMVTDDAMAKQIALVIVRGPFKTLTESLILADTPGFGAATTSGNDGKQQSELLSAYLESHVHEVYFCVAAGNEWTISDIERDFYLNLNVYCSHLLVNKWEGDEKEKQDYEARYSSLFPNAEFLFVNAKRALASKKSGDEKLFDDSNIQSFMDIIEKNSSVEQRSIAVAQGLKTAWEDIHRQMKRCYKLDGMPWRKLYYDDFIDGCETQGIRLPNVALSPEFF